MWRRAGDGDWQARVPQLPRGLPTQEGVCVEDHCPGGIPGGAQVPVIRGKI